MKVFLYTHAQAGTIAESECPVCCITKQTHRWYLLVGSEDAHWCRVCEDCNQMFRMAPILISECKVKLDSQKNRGSTRSIAYYKHLKQYLELIYEDN